MTTTRVKQLTGSNIAALKELGLADRSGATYAEWDVAPAAAFQRVQVRMNDYIGDRRAHPYRSLVAVRNKLRDAENAETKYVKVTDWAEFLCDGCWERAAGAIAVCQDFCGQHTDHTGTCDPREYASHACMRCPAVDRLTCFEG